MAELTRLYEEQGFNNITTYIQSGNVIFESNVKSNMKLQKKIESAVFEKYKFHVSVDIRTHKGIADIVSRCPFTEVKNEANGKKVLVTFLQTVAKKSDLEHLHEYVKPPERLIQDGKAIYLYCPNGYGKSRLTNAFIENKLSTIATTRNWKTVLKLAELSG